MGQFLTERLGDSTVQAYLRYHQSEDPENADLEMAMSGAEQAEIRWGRAEQMLETFADYQQFTFDAVDLEQLGASPISTDTVLTATRLEGMEGLELEPPVAISSGDPIELRGVVRNHTQEHIFVGPGDLVVEVPAGLLGLRGQPEFLEPTFPPTLRSRLREDTVWTAFGPGSETNVSWHREIEVPEGRMDRVTSWLDRKPGDYLIRAHLEGWPGHLPSEEDQAIRRQTADYIVHVRASMTHLLPLAWIGGPACPGASGSPKSCLRRHGTAEIYQLPQGRCGFADAGDCDYHHERVHAGDAAPADPGYDDVRSRRGSGHAYTVAWAPVLFAPDLWGGRCASFTGS